MKKARQLIIYGIIFAMGFLSWNIIDGRGYGVLQYLSAAGESRALPFVVWSAAVLVTYIVYPAAMIRIIRGKPIGRLEQISAYLALSATLVFYCILYVLCRAAGDSFRLAPWILIRSGLILVIYLVHRIQEDERMIERRKQREAASVSRHPSDGFHVAASLMFCADILLCPWARIGGRSFTAADLVLGIIRKGGAGAALRSLSVRWESEEYANAALNLWAVFLVIAAAVLLLAALFPVFRQMRSAFRTAAYSLCFVYICVYMIFLCMDAMFGLIAAMLLVLADALGGRYLDERKRLQKQARELRERNRLKLEEKRKREYFPGHYDREFFAVTVKNFRYRRHDYVLFFAGAAGIVTIFFVLYGFLSQTRSAGEGASDYYQDLMKSVVRHILPIMAVAAVLILSMILTHYIRTRMRGYSVFNALGIRRSTLRLIMGTEYFLCIFGSLAAGLIVGRILLTGRPVRTGFTAGVTSLSFLMLALVATLVNYHLFEYKNIMNLRAENQNEWRPKRLLPVWIAAGAVMVFTAFHRFAERKSSESQSFGFLLLVGMFFLIGGIAALYLNRRADAAADQGSALLSVMPWRHRYLSQFRLWFLLFAFHFLVMGCYLPELATLHTAEDVSSLYPYDYVYMTDAGDRDLTTEIRKLGASVESFPMLRVTTPLGQELTWEQEFNNPYQNLWPQGQHIAVPESVYRRLERNAGRTPEKLNLRGKKVHIVFQQDRATASHPLEWYLNTGNRFRFGLPVRSYLAGDRDRIFPDHAGTIERAVLTGVFFRGQMENIIVVSDEYFDKVREGKTYSRAESAEGPTTLNLVKKGSAPDHGIRSALKKLSARHADELQYDSRIRRWYGRSGMISDAGAGRKTETTAYFLICAGFLAAGLVVFYIKYGLEQDERKAEFRLYHQLGMPARSRRRLMEREMAWTVCGSWIIAAVSSVPFVLSIVHLRLYTTEESAAFAKALLAGCGIYSLLFAAGVFFIGKRYIREFCN